MGTTQLIDESVLMWVEAKASQGRTPWPTSKRFLHFRNHAKVERKKTAIVRPDGSLKASMYGKRSRRPLLFHYWQCYAWQPNETVESSRRLLSLFLPFGLS